MIKKYFKLILAVVLSFSFVLAAGCGASGEKEVTVKVGISGTDTRIWDFVAEKAKKEGINIEIVKFSDYVLPNTALAEGELDANAFQTIAYFNAFKKQHNLELSAIGTTVLAPMGVYSEKIKSLQEIPEGSKIAVPNDVTNQARALLLLQEGGVIKLASDFDDKGGLDKITENPKKLEIVPMVAAQTPRALPDVAASVINNGVAVDAGFNPIKDSIFHEGETAKPYLNIIATRTQDKDRAELKKLVELYQADDTKKLIEETYKGGMIPTFVPLSETSAN